MVDFPKFGHRCAFVDSPLIYQLSSVKLCYYSDIAECYFGTHNCSQICVEQIGGFKCNCSWGYELQEDGITCEGY